ncbi:PIG-L family deacetylase [Bacillus sp. SCS-153A]|uniref:PIG-L family deacetylase n=1 Tax=Rossellomorea sedimentorum TaxID=3115294 RepID=UPI00390638C4
MKLFHQLLSYSLLFILLNACSFIEGEPNTSVFYAPHADDEVLSLGPSILHQIDKGNEVAVVLLSHGEASQSFHAINEKLTTQGLSPLTREEFGKARVKEFRKAVKELGVKEENVFVYDLPDGQINKESVKEVMIEMNKKYPEARHHALSFNDPHSDHSASGEALLELTENNIIQSALFYLPIQEFENLTYNDHYKLPDNLHKDYVNSLESYYIWDPDSGFYSIGNISVESYFEKAHKYKESRWHR